MPVFPHPFGQWISAPKIYVGIRNGVQLWAYTAPGGIAAPGEFAGYAARIEQGRKQ